MKVAQDIDVDNKTTEVKDNKIVSKLILTDREAIVPVSAISHLIFRETDNCDYPMLCTGILVNGVWYGDRPDDGQFTNPFTGQVVTVGNSAPRVALRVEETYSGVQIVFENWGKDPKLTRFYIQGVLAEAPRLVSSTNGTYVYRISSTRMAFSNQIYCMFHFNNQTNEYYESNMPRVKFENSLGHYEYSGTSVDEVISQLLFVEEE